MAFGKKDKGSDAAAAAEPVVDAVEPEAPLEALESAAEAAAATVSALEPEAEAPAAEAPASTDALMSVFQSTQAEAEDITLLLDLAGDVAIDDLLENLHIVAAALGIETRVDDVYDDEAVAA